VNFPRASYAGGENGDVGRIEVKVQKPITPLEQNSWDLRDCGRWRKQMGAEKLIGAGEPINQNANCLAQSKVLLGFPLSLA
jgi:hypothetical protein